MMPASRVASASLHSYIESCHGTIVTPRFCPHFPPFFLAQAIYLHFRRGDHFVNTFAYYASDFRVLYRLQKYFLLWTLGSSLVS